jgi:O-methyltransferase
MIGLRRLDNLQECVETVLKDGVEGDLIETGVWRGGSCIFMKAILAAYGDDRRKVYVADSFAGLPRPDPEKYPADTGDDLYQYDYLAVSLEQVKQNFAAYGLLDEHVVFLEGWFKDTLPHAPVEKLAVMRLDGDLYESTIEALESLYPKLQHGGFCIIDDYALPTCLQAVDDFRRTHGIRDDLVAVDWSGVYWRKSR